MEWVNHVHVVEVGRGCLIRDVDGVFQRQVPNGESLKFGVSRSRSALVFIVELAQAYGHLAASRARRCDDDEGAFRFHEIVFPEAFVGGDEFHVVWITLDEVVTICLDAVAFKALLKLHGGRLSVVVGDDHGADHEASVLKFASQSQHVFIVGDAEVGAFLVFLNVGRTDDDDDFNAVAQFLKHAQLAVGQETRQHAAGVVVVEELAAQFQIQFTVKLGNSLLDVFGLNFLVLLVVKSYVHDVVSL